MSFDTQGAEVLAAGLNFIDDEVGEVRIGPVRSVSVGFLNEVAAGTPRKRLVLTKKDRLADRQAEDNADGKSIACALQTFNTK